MGTCKNKFIELHGEADWEEEKKRRDTRRMAWKEAHKDKWKEYQHNYKARNKEKIAAASKEYYDSHKEHYAELQKDYIKTAKGRAKSMLGSYKRVDKETGTGTCTLTQKWILENIFNSSCVYCGETDWKKLGCDRIDNEKAHTPENCVCACISCNATRADRWTVEEFKRLKGGPELDHPASSSM